MYKQVENDDIWYVSDLHGTKILPVQKLGDGFHISNEEFNGYGLYFWYGNNSFAGYHLDSYGLKLVFHVGWIQARGDTSGRMIQEFDVIIRVSKCRKIWAWLGHIDLVLFLHIFAMPSLS